MQKSKKFVLVVNDMCDLGYSYGLPFVSFGKLTTDIKILDESPEDVALVVFTGGADVSPSLYNHEKLPNTWNNPERDEHEVKVFNKVKALGIPMFGICRGSQFLCVMAGGTLVQHVNNHGGQHDMRTHDGRLLKVNSTHHQMQFPPKGAKLLAWCEPPRSSVYEGFSGTPEHENECVYYPNIKAIGAQYHPEAMKEHTDGFKYCVELADLLINDPSKL